MASVSASAPIGIFDSGIGGLSVLRHIRTHLPQENLLYVADSGFAPYGDRSEATIISRSHAITAFLRQFDIKALVVACNTATAVAIQSLRQHYPNLPIVGVEPGLKPAAALTQTRIVGVLATERTLASHRFCQLEKQISALTNVQFLLQACTGLADQIEKGELHSFTTAALVRNYLVHALEKGADTLVLGCTHYPFVQPLIEDTIRLITSRPVHLVDTGEPVTRQLERLLTARNLLNSENFAGGAITGFTSGSQTTLASAFFKLLNLHPPVTQIFAHE